MSNTPRCWSACLFAAVLLSLLATGREALAQESLRLGGSPFASVILTKLVSAFEPSCGPRGIQLSGDGPEIALTKLRQGQLDAAILTAAPSATQRAALGGRAADLRLSALAADAVAVVVHADNPVTDISQANLRLVLLDKINNWQALGGEDRLLVVQSRDASSALMDALRNGLLRGEPVRPDAIIQGSSDGMLRVVERYEPTVGFVFASELRDTVKVLRVDGVQPSADNAASGSYPLSRTVYLANLGEPSPLLARFIDFVRNEAGQDILRANGFAPLPKP